MRIFEEFTRCECGQASLLKETYVHAVYTMGQNKQAREFRELPGSETRYVCANCKQLIFVKREL